jgi:hypothetical protein
MSWVKVTRIIDRDAVIEGLIRLREEWQAAADGAPLVDVSASVGLILTDVVNAFRLLPEETALILGEEMCIVPLAQLSFSELSES